jgi:hypothetical protein
MPFPLCLGLHLVLILLEINWIIGEFCNFFFFLLSLWYNPSWNVVIQLLKKSHHHFQNSCLYIFPFTESLEPTHSSCISSHIFILSSQSFVRTSHFLFYVQMLYALPIIIMKNNFMHEGIWSVFKLQNQNWFFQLFEVLLYPVFRWVFSAKIYLV